MTLRVFGDDLDPKEATRLLGAEPSSAQVKGEVLTSKRGTSRIAPTGSWLLRGKETSPADLDTQVLELLSRVTNELDAWQSLRDRFRLDLHFGWFLDVPNEMTSISSATLAAVAERGLALSFDVYGGSEDDD